MTDTIDLTAIEHRALFNSLLHATIERHPDGGWRIWMSRRHADTIGIDYERGETRREMIAWADRNLPHLGMSYQHGDRFMIQRAIHPEAASRWQRIIENRKAQGIVPR